MSTDDQHMHSLARARNYPYEFPAHSYTYKDGVVSEFDPEMTKLRTPVLAIGSNQAPQRLTQKFGHQAQHVIPVQRARLADFDVVYCAHIASYGAVPAMLQASPGAQVAIAVTWLDDEQLEIMHASEISAANYYFAALDNVNVTLDDGRVHRSAYAYVGSRGHLNIANGALALAAIDCSHRQYQAVTTTQALEHIRRRAANELDADTFVRRLIIDQGYRQHITSIISSDAVAFQQPVRVLRSKP